MQKIDWLYIFTVFSLEPWDFSILISWTTSFLVKQTKITYREIQSASQLQRLSL